MRVRGRGSVRIAARLVPPAALAVLCAAAALPATAAAGTGTKWLCKPGLERDPCRTGLATTVVSPAGEPKDLSSPQRSRPRRVDCFYVYPTVSDQPTRNADRSVDPELRSIALYQAARYSQHCRVWAPVYRQITLAGLGAEGLSEEAVEIAYGDVLRAWRAYSRRNRSRGVVLVGHSQGTFMLQRLIAEEIDRRRGTRRRLLAAILLGGGVTVADGEDRGGSFDRVPACRRKRQLGCVIAFATFNDAVPEDSRFGRTEAEGERVLCTNPAALGGGPGRVRSIYPSEPFAPGSTIALAIGLLGAPVPSVETPWYETRGAYSGRCSAAGGANVLQIEERAGAPALAPVPDARWGLHLADANIALGNLTHLVRAKARRYVDRRD